MKLIPRPVQIAALLLIAAGASLSLSLCRAREEFQSAWHDPRLSPEEEAARWAGSMTSLEKSDLLLGVENDGDTLYLRLETQNPGVSSSALFRGLIVDLEPKGGRPFSVQYPIGLRGSGWEPPARGGQGGPGGGDQGGGGDQRARDNREKLFEEAQQTLDAFLLQDGDSREPLRYAVENGFGIGLKANATSERLEYALQIPLRADAAHPHALGAAPGSLLTLSIRTPEPERKESGERPEGGHHGGMHGGMHGGGRGGYGGMPGGGGRGSEPPGGRPEPLDVKLKVLLALAPQVPSPGPTTP